MKQFAPKYVQQHGVIMTKRLPYLNQTVLSPDGTPCRVLFVEGLCFDGAPIGRKCSTTLVRRARQNEQVVTFFSDGTVESVTQANENDAIFENSPTDRYIPRDASGNPFNFQHIEQYGYQIVEQGSSDCLVKSKLFAKLLVGAVRQPTCILDAFGEGNHQFLFVGATLKQDILSGKITGISKEAFVKTWKICSQSPQFE